MGLLTEEVDVCITNNNQKYYEDLGYCIPKRINKNGKEIVKSGTYIKVKTNDLPKDSHYKVDVLCDCCGDKFTVRYSQYHKNTNRNNGNYICSSTKLTVGNKRINTTDVTYEDLIILYQQYIDIYGEVPVFSKCDSKHNIPQGRIINRVIADKGITYNDFLLQFGKVSHVRTESKDYDIYVKRFKEISDKLGHVLRGNELTNNKYGLPNQGWFIKNCPDKSVKTYDGFIQWCGYKSNKLEKDRDFVANTLIALEKKLQRPITRYDISLEKTGFSMIVLNRMFGGLTKAKEELGLMKTITNPPISIEECKEKIETRLNNIYMKTGRKFISWHDIESDEYPDKPLNHKTYHYAFRRNNENLNAYIKSLGFTMCQNNIGNTYTFDDGEVVKSTFEFDFSTYLRKHHIEYRRNVRYKTFTDAKSNIDCDYVIQINGKLLYIEIAGIIYNTLDDDWRERVYHSKRENIYRDKMIIKENLLIDANVDFIFLFPWDMVSGKYIDILNNKIDEIAKEAA